MEELPGNPVPTSEWFDLPDNDTGEAGLSFGCTMCGECCSGLGGYVLYTDEEADGLARRFGITREEFIRRYTHDTAAGRSLREVSSEHGLDCIFLDRTKIPGRAVCGVYSKDVAATKVELVCTLARRFGHPLQCILEAE